MDKSLNLIKKLEQLIVLGEGDALSIETDFKKAIIETVFKNEHIGVMVVKMPKGMEFPTHFHNGVEKLYIVNGEIDLHVKTLLGYYKKVKLKAKESYIIAGNQAHYANTVKDTILIGILESPEDDYPDML